MTSIEEKVKAEGYDGYINTLIIHGKKYKLMCEVVETYPIVCPKCGASFELKYGSGKCSHCETYYTSQFKLSEVS